ncbi:MAG: 50S ribosomal protein L11 methyltransferase [Lachnospiraceae bacterium]|nr:50S ribosomal protein L11 methyltransferase [Lachnospiraceae bacterium]
MKWKRFTIDTTTEAIDFISDMLNERGVEGIEIEDNVPLTEQETKGMFVDILPELPPDDGRAKVHFYLSADPETRDAVFQCGDAPRRAEEPETSEEELLASVREGLEEIRLFCDAGSCEITCSETEDKDWMNSWKEYFRPFTVENILIKPAWEEVPAEYADKLCVTVDPGSAFGTGTHETTQLCSRQLIHYVKPGMEVLDVGCGSGILGITALKLGAAHAVGTDLDECAVTGTHENAALNGLGEADFHVILGNILDDPAVQDQVGEARCDLAVANILAPVIIELVKEIPRHLKPGAVFITSGIVEEREADVVRAFTESLDFELLEVTRQNEWVSVTARRR